MANLSFKLGRLERLERSKRAPSTPALDLIGFLEGFVPTARRSPQHEFSARDLLSTMGLSLEGAEATLGIEIGGDA